MEVVLCLALQWPPQTTKPIEPPLHTNNVIDKVLLILDVRWTYTETTHIAVHSNERPTQINDTSTHHIWAMMNRAAYWLHLAAPSARLSTRYLLAAPTVVQQTPCRAYATRPVEPLLDSHDPRPLRRLQRCRIEVVFGAWMRLQQQRQQNCLSTAAAAALSGAVMHVKVKWSFAGYALLPYALPDLLQLTPCKITWRFGNLYRWDKRQTTTGDGYVQCEPRGCTI